MLGQNGLACGKRLTTSCDAASMTASSGVKLEQTKHLASMRIEHSHARTIREFDATRFFHERGIDHRHVILTANGYPQFAPIDGKKRFVWRAAHVNGAFDFIRRGVNQRDRIRAYRYDDECLGVGRVAETMHQELPAIEWAEGAGYRIAEPDHAEQLVAGRIDNGDGVRSLVRRVNAIVGGDGDVWTSPGRLLRIYRERYRQGVSTKALFHGMAPHSLEFDLGPGLDVRASRCFSQSCII